MKKTGILILLLFTMSSCFIFKKKCNCPKVHTASTETQTNSKKS